MNDDIPTFFYELRKMKNWFILLLLLISHTYEADSSALENSLAQFTTFKHESGHIPQNQVVECRLNTPEQRSGPRGLIRIHV
jgi:hypothetical protein